MVWMVRMFMAEWSRRSAHGSASAGAVAGRAASGAGRTKLRGQCFARTAPAACVGAVADVLPVALPLLAPRERPVARRTLLGRRDGRSLDWGHGVWPGRRGRARAGDSGRVGGHREPWPNVSHSQGRPLPLCLLRRTTHFLPAALAAANLPRSIQIPAPSQAGRNRARRVARHGAEGTPQGACGAQAQTAGRQRWP
jgi:hypothetical protein